MSVETAVAFNPVWAALITVLGALLLAWMENMRRSVRAVHGEARAAREQVQNSHSTNLRDDMDKIMASQEQIIEGQSRHDDALRQHGKEIGGLREDLRQERDERLRVSDRLDNHLESIATAS